MNQIMDYAIFLSIIDVLYKLSILLLGFIIVLGYMLHLGYRDKIERYLEKTRPFDIKIRNARNGYFIINLLVLLILFSYLIYGEFSSLKLVNNFLIDVLGTSFLGLIFYFTTVTGLTLVLAIYLKFETKKVFIAIFLVSLIGAFILTYLKNYLGIIALVSVYLFFFILLPICILKWGRLLAKSLEIEYKTTVELKGGKSLKNLNLYQTTETDYRLEDNEGNEYIIPVANVDKIIYKKEKQEKE